MTISDTLRTRTTLLSVNEAADILGIHKLTLYCKIQARKFPVVRIGSASIRVDPSTLADWLEARTS